MYSAGKMRLPKTPQTRVKRRPTMKSNMPSATAVLEVRTRVEHRKASWERERAKRKKVRRRTWWMS